MVKQREGFVQIIEPIATERIARGECPSCGLPKDKWTRRTDWTCCSPKCTRKFWDKLVIYNGWQDLRRKVLARDNNKCVKCNIEMPSHKLVADHIEPIALGGEEWDIDNIQTLCQECNKLKTKLDIHKIAKLRRVEKVLVDGQKQL